MTDHYDTLLDVISKLGDEEIEVLTMQAQRLLAGQNTYGKLHLESDRRDFVKEALEEALDMTTYLTCKLAQMRGRDAG